MLSTTTKTSKAAPKAKSSKRAPARERRRSNRIPSHTAGKVGSLTVQISDVSLQGVGFLSPTRLEPHSHHPILIGNGPMYLEGQIQITSVRPQKDGAFIIGAIFV